MKLDLGQLNLRVCGQLRLGDKVIEAVHVVEIAELLGSEVNGAV